MAGPRPRSTRFRTVPKALIPLPSVDPTALCHGELPFSCRRALHSRAACTPEERRHTTCLRSATAASASDGTARTVPEPGMWDGSAGHPTVRRALPQPSFLAGRGVSDERQVDPSGPTITCLPGPWDHRRLRLRRPTRQPADLRDDRSSPRWSASMAIRSRRSPQDRRPTRMSSSRGPPSALLSSGRGASRCRIRRPRPGAEPGRARPGSAATAPSRNVEPLVPVMGLGREGWVARRVPRGMII